MDVILNKKQLVKLIETYEGLDPKLAKLIEKMIMYSDYGEENICKIKVGWDFNSEQVKLEIFADEKITNSRDKRENLIDEIWSMIYNWTGKASSIFVKKC